MKLVVSSLYILETVQLIILTRDAFRMFSSGWGDLGQADDIGLLWFGIPVMAGISTSTLYIFCYDLICVVSNLNQLFYAWRIYSLSRNFWIPGIIATVSYLFASYGRSFHLAELMQRVDRYCPRSIWNIPRCALSQCWSILAL